MKNAKMLKMEDLQTIEDLREKGIEPKAYDGTGAPEWPSGEWECCLCGRTFPVLYTPEGTETRVGMNNPAPLGNPDKDVCCMECDRAAVIPRRMANPIRQSSRRLFEYFWYVMRTGSWIEPTYPQGAAS